MPKPSITKRQTKNAALTYAELDTNFQNLADATVSLTAGSGGTAVTVDLNGNITLVAGTNVTITGDNTAKTITISSSGGGGGGIQNPLTSDLDLGNFALADSNGVATVKSTQGVMVKSIAYANAELTITPGDISNATSRISTKEGILVINTNNSGLVSSFITLNPSGQISINATNGNSITLGSTGGVQIACGSASTDKVTIDSPLKLNPITTTERNALSAENGMIIFNSTTGKFQGYEGGSWQNLI